MSRETILYLSVSIYRTSFASDLIRESARIIETRSADRAHNGISRIIGNLIRIPSDVTLEDFVSSL